MNHRLGGVARRALPVAVGLALWSAAGPGAVAASGSFQPQPETSIEQQTSELLTKVIQDPQALAAVRTEAAALLVQRALSSSSDQAYVEEILRGPATELSAAWYVLGGLSRQSTLPDWVLTAVTALVPGADERTQARAVTSLAAVRTREAVRFLVETAAASSSDAVRRAAYQSLVRLTGKSDLNDSPDAWRAWLEQTESLSREEWSALLVRGLARRSDAAESARQAAVARLVEASRRVHFTLPADQRGEFLAGLLRDDTDELRSLGFELASRELSENVRLGASVESAAISLLRSPVASVREKSARLIAQLSPPAAREPVTTVLRDETDPAAAAALLRAASRWPDPTMLEVALHWVGAQNTAMASAVDYIRSLVRAGYIQDPAERQRVLEAIRTIPPDMFPPGACDVIVSLGGDDDLKAVAQQLSSPHQPVRFAAAQSLLVVADHVDDILLAAQNDPELFDIAVRAVSMYWPTAQGFRSIASLRAPSQEAWRRGLLKLAEMMPAPDLVEVAGSVEANLREPLLASLTSPNRILSERYSTETFEGLGAGLVELARLRIDLGKPDAALAALDSMPELGVLEGENAVNSLRAEALLCLGRIDDASLIPSDPSAWMNALDRSIDKPFARELAQVVRDRFSARLTDEQSARLALLQRRLAGLGAGPTDDGQR